MDFKRIFVILLLTCIIFPSFAKTKGLAFVHGTGDHRADAFGRYWKTEYMAHMTKGVENPNHLYVVHCDFRQYMWHDDAGTCTATQLADFIRAEKLDSITVFTHSNGGNVLRWILSNPTYHPDYAFLKGKISKIIALTPSSGGTVLADKVLHGGSVQTNLGWLLGFSGDAIKQQRVGDMALYNADLLFGTPGRPPLPVPFKTIVGTDAIASPVSSASYCNGYMLNSSLKLTKLYLDECSDGFLNCTSQALAGTVWFYDKDKLENGAVMNHNQSRHSCFGMDKILGAIE